jgi:predicted NodU family carbamoyl transferase
VPRGCQHLAHLGSAFLVSPFEDAAVLETALVIKTVMHHFSWGSGP